MLMCRVYQHYIATRENVFLPWLNAVQSSLFTVILIQNGTMSGGTPLNKAKLAFTKQQRPLRKDSNPGTNGQNGFSTSCGADLMPSTAGPSGVSSSQPAGVSGSPATQHRSFSSSQPSTSHACAGSPKISDRNSTHAGRRLQMVLVMDQKQQKFLKARELATKQIESISDSMNVQLNIIDFTRLDYGETKTLDIFYSADVAVVDFSFHTQQPSLSYHVGVRESMQQIHNIIIMYRPDEAQEYRISEALKKTFPRMHLVLYYLCPEDQTILLSVDKSSRMDRFQGFDADRFRKKGHSNRQTFAERIRQALASVQIDVNAHAKEKFLSDLRKVQDMTNDEASQFLENMRARLDNPDVMAPDTVIQMLLCYRDAQDYDAMINLVDDLKKIGRKDIVYVQAVRFHYAFALNRRNLEGDRERCIQTVVNIMKTAESKKEPISPDVVCLAGRVYKDKFIASNYEDKESLEQAIQWYRKAFEISPLEYSGINLTTLLRARGELFDHNIEMQQVSMVLNSAIGRKGAIEKCEDYWDVATFFEVSVLVEDYKKACQAAQAMAMLKPPMWFLKSTMENIKLISRCAATVSPIEKEKQTFVFWTDFFMEAIESSGKEITSCRFPVLIQEFNKEFTPSYITINIDDVIILSHVLENSQKKSPPPGIHRWEFKASNIRAVSANKRDNRSMFLYVHDNSDDFCLTFPSADICNRVIELMECDGKVLHDCGVQNQIQYEYDYDSNGDKIILGRGTYGTVYSARDVATQRTIVIKEVEVKNDEEVQPLMEEIQLHSTLSHPNIVKYLGSKLITRENGNDVFLIFMEQVPGGSLSSLLRSKWGPLDDSDSTMAFYARQILEGINYLHQQKIVHRDIKGENVLVNTYSGLCKISDFGTCKRLLALNPVADTFKGTLQYMAPEVIDRGQRGYGAPADIWSFGCTMVEMATGQPPFAELGLPQAAMFHVGMYKTSPTIPKKLSDQARTFILRCFEPDAAKRPTAVELLADPFITSNTRGSSFKKRSDGTKPHANSKFMRERSVSHLSGMGLTQNGLSPSTAIGCPPNLARSNSTKYPSKTMATPGFPTSTTSDSMVPRTSKGNLKLKIEGPYVNNNNNMVRSNHTLIPGQPQPASASPKLCPPSFLMGTVDTSSLMVYQGQNGMMNGTTSPSIMQLSQPSSPLREMHTPLTASPSFGDGSPFSNLPSSSTSIPEEANGFFNLQKDVELRRTLAALMGEHEADIIERWTNTIEAEITPNRFKPEALKLLLKALRHYLLQKDCDALSQALNDVLKVIGETHIDDLCVAMYLFPNSVHPALKHRGIKPHWMFSLDDLIRSGIQSAVNCLVPEQPSHNLVQEANKQYGQSVAAAVAAATAAPTDVMAAGSLPDLTQQHAFYAEQIRRLFEDLIGVEREYKQLLEQTIVEKRQWAEELSLKTDQPKTPLIQTPLPIIFSGPSDLPDENLEEFLRRIGCDPSALEILEQNNYTRNDLIDFVNREELISIGIKGGTACRIWREILRIRQELLQKQCPLSSTSVKASKSMPNGTSGSPCKIMRFTEPKKEAANNID
uniref:mitogen-activated protein kinase kinase kinase n=1 Tax=Panagrellus redivivus TaxID=6233 RepID=A0A7E4USM4_PANRE